MTVELGCSCSVVDRIEDQPGQRKCPTPPTYRVIKRSPFGDVEFFMCADHYDVTGPHERWNLL